MDISSIGAAVGEMTAGKLRLDVTTAVLDKALDAGASAALSLVASMAEAIPAGLTFSQSGLSPGSSSRIIATL